MKVILHTIYTSVFLFSMTILGVASTNTCCPDTWVAYGGSCYLFTTDTTLNFYEAEHFCRQHNGHLVHIDNAEENAFIKSFLKALKPGERWIGLTDERIEGVFKWYDTDTTPSFTDWRHGDPDDYHGGEDCVCFDIDFKWNDVHCKAMYKPICEKRSGEAEIIG